MNCMPNDLAVLVRNTTGVPCLDNNIGATLEVSSSFHGPLTGVLAWKLKRPINCAGCGLPLFSLFDADLHPIRPAPPPITTSVSEGLREVRTEPVA